MTSEEKLEATAQLAIPEVPLVIYAQDGLRSIHNHEFLHEPAFQAA